VSALEDDFLTVAETASLLRVSPATIRRWIRTGDVPAWRLGPRRIALRRSEVAGLIAPVAPRNDRPRDRSGDEQDELDAVTPEEVARQRAAIERLREQWRAEDAARGEPILVRKLTPEEKERGLEAMRRMKELSDEILARRGGVPFSSSTEIIREMREERTRQLMEALE
jgi:excisionase family DNA binding protein